MISDGATLSNFCSAWPRDGLAAASSAIVLQQVQQLPCLEVGFGLALFVSSYHPKQLPIL
jgi:hypothetical protein